MKQITALLFSLLFVFSACKRGEGDGGSSSIKGKVYRIKYNLNFTAALDSGYLDKEDVYIIYGDDATFGDDQKTNYDGTYEFKYLRKGKYKIFAYENDSSKYPVTANKVVLQEVEIKKNKETVEVPDLILVK